MPKSELTNIDKLHTWDQNPRRIEKEELEKLKRNLQEYPELHEANPILALKDGEIFAGNQRYTACKELGIEEYPVITYDCDKKRAIEMAIIDNTHAGQWVQEELVAIAQEHDIDLAEFNIDADIEKAIEKLEPEIEEDEVPEPKKDPETVLGDLWQLGEHRLLCGDATKVDDVERLMDGEKADMVFTDPPYNIDYQSGTWSEERKKTMGKIKNDAMGDEEFVHFLSTSLLLMSDNTNGDQYICSDWKVYHLFRDAILSTEQKIKNVIVWNKMYQTQALNKYANAHEFILFLGDNSHPYKDINVWDCKREFNPDHPTPKPIEIISKAIQYSGGKSVLDIFGGSGSTLIACEQLNRKCYMMELDPQYIRVIIDRWEKLTGEKAILLSK